MSSMRPVAFYGLKVVPDGYCVDSRSDIPGSEFRITMAAIDPTEQPITNKLTSDVPPRATLRLLRSIPLDSDDLDSDEEYDDDDIEAIKARLGITEDDDDEEELLNGGPSDPGKAEKARKAALVKALLEEQDDMDVEDDELTNGINGKVNKGKARATDDDDEDEDEDEDDDQDDNNNIIDEDWEEHVLCTLDPKQHYQQPLDITINEHEDVWFKVEGTHTVYLTGNYIIPADEFDSEEDDDEDSEDDEQMDMLSNEILGGLQDDYDEDDLDDEEEEEEDDELDDLDDPRVTEVDSDDEAPQLVKAQPSKKSKNKRPADESDEEAITEDALKNILKADGTKMSKRQAKKLKNNAGQAVAGASDEKPAKKDEKDNKKKEEKSPSNGKKVQFAEKLEQGPTGANAEKKGIRVVNGVTIDDKKPGSGPGAKKGDNIGMRYIGKLKDGKVFDSNKKGQPFKFKLGSGAVIKGWDIGVQGMCVGGERRITVPAKLAYGSKSMPGIPANSDLIFDLKLISIN